MEKIKKPAKLAVKKEIEATAKKLTKNDLGGIIAREKEIRQNIKKFSPSLFGEIQGDVETFYSMIKDYKDGKYTEIPWYAIAMAAAAILYLTDPFDLIPDSIPGLGEVNDVLIVIGVITAVKAELERYRKWKKSEQHQTGQKNGQNKGVIGRLIKEYSR